MTDVTTALAPEPAALPPPPAPAKPGDVSRGPPERFWLVARLRELDHEPHR